MVLSVSYLGSFGRELRLRWIQTFNPSRQRSPTRLFPVDHSTSNVHDSALHFSANTGFGAMTRSSVPVNSKYNALTIQSIAAWAVACSLTPNTPGHIPWISARMKAPSRTPTTFSSRPISRRIGNSLQRTQSLRLQCFVAESPWKTNGWTNYLVSGWEIAPIYQPRWLAFLPRHHWECPGGVVPAERHRTDARA